MDTGATVKAVTGGLAWRIGGLSGAGRFLLEALGGDDEQVRMLAGIALVRAGDRSIDLIESAIEGGTASPAAVRLLGDIGGARVRPILERLASAGEDLAPAASETLGLLNRMDAVGDDET